MRHIKCWSEFDLLYFGFPTWDLYIYVCNHLSKYFLTPASPNNNVIDSAGCLGGGLIMPRTASRCWSTGLQKSIQKFANCKNIQKLQNLKLLKYMQRPAGKIILLGLVCHAVYRCIISIQIILRMYTLARYYLVDDNYHNIKGKTHNDF